MTQQAAPTEEAAPLGQFFQSIECPALQAPLLSETRGVDLRRSWGAFARPEKFLGVVADPGRMSRLLGSSLIRSPSHQLLLQAQGLPFAEEHPQPPRVAFSRDAPAQGPQQSPDPFYAIYYD